MKTAVNIWLRVEKDTTATRGGGGGGGGGGGDGEEVRQPDLPLYNQSPSFKMIPSHGTGLLPCRCLPFV